MAAMQLWSALLPDFLARDSALCPAYAATAHTPHLVLLQRLAGRGTDLSLSLSLRQSSTSGTSANSPWG